MKKRLVLVEIDDNVRDAELKAEHIQQLEIVSDVNPLYFSDLATFNAHWRAGLYARQNWEIFSNSFFRLLTESGMVDKEGTHFEDYTVGSICEFILDNQDVLLKDVGTALRMVVTTAVSSGKAMSKKGKKIEIPWKKMAEIALPMAEIVLHQVVIDPDRADIMMPVLLKYFQQETTALPAHQNPS